MLLLCYIACCAVIPCISLQEGNSCLVEKEIHYFQVAPINGEYERVPSVFISSVHVSLLILNKVLNKVKVTKIARSMQGSPSVLIQWAFNLAAQL